MYTTSLPPRAYPARVTSFARAPFVLRKGRVPPDPLLKGGEILDPCTCGYPPPYRGTGWVGRC